jgi:hypothetical protein
MFGHTERVIDNQCTIQKRKFAMKITLTVLAGLILAISLGMFVTRSSTGKAVQTPVVGSTETTPLPQIPVARTAQREIEQAVQPPAVTETISATVEVQKRETSSPGTMAVSQALDTLLDPKSNFQQKQATWAQLRETGKFDEAIKTLEDRAAKDSKAPEIPATLGQAYLHKAGSIQDVREQGILGMKADQTFDLALNLDSENWEARFWKATAMSYWPAQLGKGKEVIEHLVELVKQQEVQPPQPQFAQVYVLLGEQYQKQGYTDYATQAWKRGMNLFPNDETLSNKLTAAK